MKKKLRKLMAVTFAAALIANSVPAMVYASGNDVFSDGSETNSAVVFESGTFDAPELEKNLQESTGTFVLQEENNPDDDADKEVFVSESGDISDNPDNEIQENAEESCDEDGIEEIFLEEEFDDQDAADELLLAAGATSGTCGDSLAWQFSGGTLTISGSGNMYNGQPWSDIKTSIKNVVIGNAVTSIGEYSFEDCDSLRSITIGSNVKTIGFKAFFDCDSLAALTIPNSVTNVFDRAFQDCDSLASVKIGNGVTVLGTASFENCDSLTSLTLGTSITEICNYAFYDCDNLTSVEIPGKVQSIGNCAFAGGNNIQRVVIGNKVTSIGEYAFEDCDNLSSLTIGSSVTTIGFKAFFDCDLLPGVVIPDSVTNVSDRAFQDCDSLVSAKIGNGVKNLGSSAFENCDKLTSLFIGSAVEIIGNYAFFDCDSLGTVTIPNSVTRLGNSAFDSCDSLEKVTIGNSVETIGEYCFLECKSLTALTIGNSVDSIGYKAFFGCSSLPSVALPDSVTTIGDRVFQDCVKLVTAQIGNGVITIGSSAFENCDSLVNLTMGTSVITVGNYAFYDCDTLKRVTLPGSIINLNKYAFAECDSLVQATVGNGVVRIGEGAFENCRVMTSVSIGNAVTTMGYRVFSGCSSLKELTIPSKVSSIDDRAFDSSGLNRLYFTGNCPSMGNNTFNNVTATAYYPSSWTSVPSATQYGGTITWKAGSSLTITTQPVSKYAVAESNAVFTVKAVGNGLSYQWQACVSGSSTWSNSAMTGSKTASLTVPVTVGRNGYKYRCIVSDNSGNKKTSSTATLTVFGISAQPSSKYIVSGKNAVFMVKAVGSGLSYQWQACVSGSNTWSNSAMAGNKTASLTVPAIVARNGYKYRCIVTDKNGNKKISSAAVLTVFGISTQPLSKYAVAGTNAVFTVKATGSNLKYQWQTCVAGSSSWVNSGLTGNKTVTLKVAATAARSGYKFRCIVSDGNGNKVTTNIATLTAFGISAQPSGKTVMEGDMAVFTVKAAGNGLKYQWQTCVSGSSTWINSGLTGNKTASLKVSGDIGRNGYKYRCVVSDEKGNKTISTSAVLTVKKAAIPITVQPKNQYVTAGKSTVFSVGTKGSKLSYQWQTCVSGSSTWVNSSLTGNKTASLTVSAGVSRNGYKYRCVIKDGNGNQVISNAATLNVFGIVTQPSNITVASGSNAVFTVKAVGKGLSYVWMASTNGGSSWKVTSMSGAQSAKLTVPVTKARNGYKYRCLIADSNGNVATSKAVTLTVK